VCNISKKWRGVDGVQKLRAISINTVPVVVKRDGTGSIIGSWAKRKKPTGPEYTMVAAVVNEKKFPFQKVMQFTEVIAW
jgi:uncharacterized lipoprotein YddW (UPF0748 family)